MKGEARDDHHTSEQFKKKPVSFWVAIATSLLAILAFLSQFSEHVVKIYTNYNTVTSTPGVELALKGGEAVYNRTELISKDPLQHARFADNNKVHTFKIYTTIHKKSLYALPACRRQVLTDADLSMDAPLPTFDAGERNFEDNFSISLKDYEFNDEIKIRINCQKNISEWKIIKLKHPK